MPLHAVLLGFGVEMVESAFVIGHIQYGIITCNSISFNMESSHLGIFTFLSSKQGAQHQRTF
jgi:hypothetical protein